MGQSGGRRPGGQVGSRRLRRGRHHTDAHPRHGPARGLRRGGRPGPEAREDPPVRPRVQHPLRADRAPGGGGRRHGGPQGPGTRDEEAVRGRLRRPQPRGGPSGRLGPRQGDGPRNSQGPGLRAGWGHRDHHQGRDRERPLRGAGRPLRGRRPAHPTGLQGADRGRLPARARLLRGAERAEAHRRRHLQGGNQRHVRRRLGHRKVRRDDNGPRDRRRPRRGEHEGGPEGDQGRQLREGLDRRV